jgi:2,3,4,5-tetrahydropyridine-2-carboxylate N-succinyltransferase
MPDGEIVKARQLSGAGGLLYRRNSQSGAVEAIPRSVTWDGLNAPSTATTESRPAGSRITSAQVTTIRSS